MEVIDFLNASPAQGLTLLGTTGNFLHLDVEEREKLIGFALKRSRKPMGVNVAHSTLDVAVYLAEHAAACGAAFAMVLPPYYFRYTPEQIDAFLTRFAEKTHQLLPLYLYNLPFFTSAIPLETSQRLLSSGLYRGIKDSSGKPEYLSALASTGGTLIVGNDSALIASRKDVAVAVVSGCAAAVPELICAMDRAITAGDEARQAQLLPYLQEMLRWFDSFPAPVAIEEACRLRKLPCRPDTSWLGNAPLDAFRQWFVEWLPQVLADSKEP
jgi:dihydrodipicolinate synthase/N-acetylneuraminate lyase